MEESKPDARQTHSTIAGKKDNDIKDVQESQSEAKEAKDCKDHCMHCGLHCIYLKKS